MASRLTDIKQCKEICGLSGGGQHGCASSLQGCNLCSHIVIRRILQSGIEISACLQIKKLSHVLAGIIFKGGRLYDRDLSGLSVPRGISCLHTLGIHPVITHILLPSTNAFRPTFKPVPSDCP